MGNPAAGDSVDPSSGCSYSADSSGNDETRLEEFIECWDQFLIDDEQGGVVTESGEGLITGGKGRTHVAKKVEGLAIEENGRSDVEERAEVAALVASEAKGDEKAPIKNKGPRQVIEDDEQSKSLASLPETPTASATLLPAPPEPNSCQAQQKYVCTLCGVFYLSTDGYTCYAPLTTGTLRSQSSRFSLEFLPEPVHILASSYGLLCCRSTRISGRYYACNPTTMDQTMIPSPPDPSRHGDDTAVALVFEKLMISYRFESDYHVVCTYPVKGLDGGVYAFDVFSSTTWRWTTSKELCFAEMLNQMSGVGVAGKACWTTTMNTAVIFDPAKDKLQMVPWPAGYSDGDITWSLAELEGELCAVCLRSSSTDVGTEVYTLENRSKGGGAKLGWRKKREIV